MGKRFIVKLIAYGLVQWLILNIAIFVVSLISGVKEGAEMTAPPTMGFVIVAVIMIGVAYAFGRWLKPANRKSTVIAGLVWSGMTTVFLLVTVFVNSTQNVFFSGWGVYLIFIAQLIGSLLVSPAKVNVGFPPPTV